jgi:hypothetical protein
MHVPATFEHTLTGKLYLTHSFVLPVNTNTSSKLPPETELYNRLPKAYHHYKTITTHPAEHMLWKVHGAPPASRDATAQQA